MPPVIEVRNLHKRYADKVAVDDVSLTVQEGEIFGILGPNGAGKTTTVECVEGLRKPDRGEIRVLGLDPLRDRAELTRRLGVQLQAGHLPERLQVAEALELYSSFYPQPTDWRTLLDGLGLADKAKTRYAKLSGGQKQRLSIALALVGSPRVAILDELTTGLDPQARRDTWGLIEGVRARGVTIVLVTHFMEEAERLCDRIVLIDAGRVVATGTPAELALGSRTQQVLRFRTDRPVPADVVAVVPGVSSVDADGGGGGGHGDGGHEYEVRSHGDVVQDVMVALAGAHIRADQVRIENGSLEDAFVALTGHPSEV